MSSFLLETGWFRNILLLILQRLKLISNLGIHSHFNNISINIRKGNQENYYITTWRESVTLPKADLPLHNITFAILGSFEEEAFQEIKDKLENFGAQVRVRSKNVTFIVSTPIDVVNKHPKIANFLTTKIVPIISSDFVNDLNISEDFDIVTTLKTHVLSDWCTEFILNHLQRKVSWKKCKAGPNWIK